MPFCRNCGSAVEGQFCPKCGTPIAAAPGAGAPPPQPPPPPPNYQQQQAYQQPAYQQPQYQQPGYQAAPAAQAGGMADNVAGLLCYVLGLFTGILFLILAPYNQNKLIRFHAFQSIFVSLGLFAVNIALMILGMIVGAIIPVIGGILFSLLGLVVMLGGLALWIMLMVKAYQGQKWVLPVVGPLAEKQA
jgi:uncharacterized membrane protein